MGKDFHQLEWDEAVEEDCRQIVRLAVREDLGRLFDWTTLCLVPAGETARAAIVARQPGIVAGLHAAEVALSEMDPHVRLELLLADGAQVAAGQSLATLSGPARSMLTSERILLNLIGRMSGIATLTRKYVDAIGTSGAHIYDTRKTTPGWRRLEKYAVRAGGGRNHRTGLFDAILIKDNHLALAAQVEGTGRLTPAEAVRRARDFTASMAAGQAMSPMIIEVEVDTLAQCEQVLAEFPDVVLLDNMSLNDLRAAVAMRNALAPAVELEASGGVNLQSVAAIAATGVERISSGALTHSAASLDVGLDWQ